MPAACAELAIVGLQHDDVDLGDGALDRGVPPAPGVAPVEDEPVHEHSEDEHTERHRRPGRGGADCGLAALAPHHPSQHRPSERRLSST